MLMHTESSVVAAIEDPAVREERLRSLRNERAIARIAGVIAVVAFVVAGLADAGLRTAGTLVLVLLVTGIVTLRADSQVNLLLAVDQIEEMVAKRSTGNTVDEDGSAPGEA